MAFDLDGLAVLGRMAAQPEAFPGVEGEAAKVARALLTRIVKDKATTLDRLRRMAGTLPAGTLAHVTDAMTDAEVSALALRLDKLDPALKAADRLAKATRVADLISGAAEPAAARSARPDRAPPERAPRAKTPGGVEAARKVLHSRAMGARKAPKARGA